MKRLQQLLIIIFALCIIFPNLYVNVSAEEEYIIFLDKNLKSALIKAGVDSNGDGEIDKSEAYSTYNVDISNSGITNLSGLDYFGNLCYLVANNNEITDITPLSLLTDLETIIIRYNKIEDAAPLSNLKKMKMLYIDYNNISDLSPFLSMENLEYLSIANNKLQTSICRDTDSSTINDLQSLRCTVYGAYNQKLDYDKSLLPDDVPTYKVLVTAVSEIDAKSKISKTDTVENKYKMSNDEVNVIKSYANLFEKYVEKLSGYRFNIEVDFYVTSDKLTKIYAPAADYGLYDYNVFAPDVPELKSKIDDYDTTITVCYLNSESHSSSGVAGYGWYDYNNKYINRGVVFIPWDIYSSETETYTEQHANEGCYDTLIDTFVHEFSHTLEQYAPLLGVNNIKEFHSALGDWENQNDAAGAIGKYLQGKKYSDNCIGVPDVVINNPPTKRYRAPKKVSNLKITSQDSDNVTLNWSKSSDVDGYKVYIYDNNSSRYMTTTSTKLKVSSLSSNKKYSFAVQPYKYFKTEKMYVYGDISSKVTTQTGPKMLSNLKYTSITTKSVTLSWNTATKATGYKVEKYNETKGKWEKVLNTQKTKVNISKLSVATRYRFRVTPYRKSGSQVYYGSQLSITIYTKPNSPKITSVKRSGTKITVVCSKVNKVYGYSVQLSSNKNFKKVYKTVSSKNNSIIIKNLNKNNKYYVRVRSYYKSNGKNVYSDYSTYKSAK